MEDAEQKIAVAVKKSHGSTSEDARMYRQRGHNDAQEFAFAVGMKDSYKNDQAAKKDVADPSFDTHSVKSGKKKWQIFLYSRGRFAGDVGWAVMNGIGATLLECIDSFPATFDEYQRDKMPAKQRLRIAMVKLKEKLQDKVRLRAFLNKSMFNGGEVEYLTVKEKEKFHVFHRNDILDSLCNNLEVCNSRAISAGQVPEQKTLLKYNGITLGEVEMRNDRPYHYKEIRFNMLKPVAMALFFGKIKKEADYNKYVSVYGFAAKRFGRWKKVVK